MDKILVEAVIRLCRKELKELESQRDNIIRLDLPLTTLNSMVRGQLDSEIKEVEAMLVELGKLG